MSLLILLPMTKTLFLPQYCSKECMRRQMSIPTSAGNKEIIKLIRTKYMELPAPKGSYNINFTLESPPWNELGHWGQIHDVVEMYFKNENDGIFVEIGAQDGEFMSLTLWLEVIKGFRGLLIEPNRFYYNILRSKNRSAFSINACASTKNGAHKDQLWLRKIPDGLPKLLHMIQEGIYQLVRH